MRRAMLSPRYWRSPRTRRTNMFVVAPTLLTLGNAVCGFASITYAARVGPEGAAGGDLYVAALYIFIAMIFDCLDGPVARLSRHTSQFGAQLDSLADAISFGVAPAFLMLKFADSLHPRLLWVIAVLYMLGAVLRLARFNVSKDGDEEHRWFSGLPSPAAAGMVASLVIVAPGLARLAGNESPVFTRRIGEFLTLATTRCMPLATLAVALLMVSSVRYPHAFNQLLGRRRSFQQLATVSFAVVVAVAVHELAIPLLFLCYVASPCLRLASGATPVSAPVATGEPTRPTRERSPLDAPEGRSHSVADPQENLHGD